MSDQDILFSWLYPCIDGEGGRSVAKQGVQPDALLAPYRLKW